VGINSFPMAFFEQKNGQMLPCELCARLSVKRVESHCAGATVIEKENMRPSLV